MELGTQMKQNLNMKKQLFFSLCFVLCAAWVQAQLITTTPAFVTDSGGEVTVVFDATQGTGGLAGYSGTVYAHTGVITSESKTDSDWKYVVADWGENVDKCKMTSLGGDKWQLTISPSIRKYYGVPSGEQIEKLAFVFRSGEPVTPPDTYAEGKADGGKDIFVEVYEQGLNVSFVQPETDCLVQPGTEVDFVVNASMEADLRLLVNGAAVQTVNATTTLSASHTFATVDDYMVVAQATAGNDVVRDTLYVCVPGDAPVAARPAGLEDGINISSTGDVSLLLYAPGKDNVFLIGDFNDWVQLNAYQMKRDGDYWWYTLTGLDAGRLYRFQYVVDGSIRISDPYTELVLDPWNDGWINSKTERYPDLPAYPTGKTDGMVATFQIDAPDYEWQVTDFTMPSKTNMVIYELLLRDFTQEQSLQAAIDRIDYLAQLGVTAVELMPIQEFDGNSSWGYAPNHYFAPDKAYGSPEMYKRFIDECHQRGIAVILDVVLNHATGTHPFAALYWDSANNRTAADNPWFNVTAPHPYSVYHDFNHSKPIVREHFKRMLRYWIEEYHVDGYRLDLSKGLTQTQSNEQSATYYDASRISYLTEYYEAARDANPDVMFILEHFCADKEEQELAAKGMYLWRNVNNAFSQSAMGYQSSSSFEAMNALPRNWVGYAESHDEERNFYKAKTWGAGNVATDSLVRFRRVPLNVAFATLIPGPKMIWEFGEIGYDVQTGESGASIRMEEKPSGFLFYHASDARREAYLASAKILNLRKQYPAVFDEGYCQLNVAQADWAQGRRIAITHADLNLVVVGNFRADANVNANPNFPQAGDWYELLTGQTLPVTNTAMQLNLAPGEVRVYTDRPITGQPTLPDLPEEPDFSGLPVHEDDAPADFLYPGVTDGMVHVSTAGQVCEAWVYDLQGKLRQCTDRPVIDLSGCADGLYIVALVTTEGRSVHRIVKR